MSLFLSQSLCHLDALLSQFRIVGVKNGYDEVNVKIPAEYKDVFPQQIMLGQENVATHVPEIKLRSNSI